jgi:hypothetical protein
VGAVSTHDFHHQVAVIQHGGVMPGALAEGPATASEIQGQGIVLDQPDEYAEFQAARGTYQDDRANYVTNEPGIASNAPMIFMLALFAGRTQTSIEEIDPALAMSTVAAWPNPFRESTRLVVRAAGASPASASLEIHDVAGRLFRRLQLRGGSATSREVTWDGLDAAGRPAPNGIYYLSTNGAARGRLVRVR